MKHLLPLSLSVLALGLVPSTYAWAACSTNVVDVGLVTTVTVSAGPDDECSWSDNNPNSAYLLEVLGAGIPTPLQSLYGFVRGASAVGSPVNVGQCEVQDLQLACEADIIGVTGSGNVRQCLASNPFDAISITATCIYTR